jgi:hypothetical protein
VDVYPALFRGLSRGNQGESIRDAREAGCFYHPLKKAVRSCAVCGRFLCALCDVHLNGKHLCSGCLESNHHGLENSHLDTQRICYDQLALLVATLPILFVWITIVTAPIAIYLCFRHWKTPGSILPRTRIRFVAAFLISLLQVGIWLLVIF